MPQEVQIIACFKLFRIDSGHSLRDRSRASRPGLRRVTPRTDFSASTRTLRSSSETSVFGRFGTPARMPKSRRCAFGLGVRSPAGALRTLTGFLADGGGPPLRSASARGPVEPLKETAPEAGRGFMPRLGIRWPAFPRALAAPGVAGAPGALGAPGLRNRSDAAPVPVPRPVPGRR